MSLIFVLILGVPVAAAVWLLEHLLKKYKEDIIMYQDKIIECQDEVMDIVEEAKSYTTEAVGTAKAAVATKRAALQQRKANRKLINVALRNHALKFGALGVAAGACGYLNLASPILYVPAILLCAGALCIRVGEWRALSGRINEFKYCGGDHAG